MDCSIHGTRDGVNTCSKCGSWLCEDCSIDIDGRIICRSCIAELVNSNSGGRKGRSTPPPPTEDSHVHHYEHHVHHEVCGKPSCKRRINRLLLLIFSFTIPGMNYMFMGLIKRGIYAMSAFLLLAYCAGSLGSPIFGIIAGVIYVVSIFDGFNVRRKLINDEFVEDGFSEITSALYKHRLPLGILTCLLVCSGVVTNIARSVYYSNYFRHYVSSSFVYEVKNFASVIFILIGIAAVFHYFIKPAKKCRRDSDVIDKTDRTDRTDRQ